MHECSSDISYFARTNHRGPGRAFGIRQADRLSHMHVIGRTGTGKSTMLAHLIRQDIAAGRGLAVVDPHGDLAQEAADSARRAGRTDLVYLDLSDPVQPFTYNPLARVPYQRIPLVASGTLEILHKLWPDAWGVRMEHILRNTLYALLEQEQARLTDILPLLTDRRYRQTVARSLRNPQVRTFFMDEFPQYTRMLRSDGIQAIQNKVGALLADPALHRLVTRQENPLRFRRIMDEGQVLVVNLAKGAIGEDSAHLLGGLLVTSIALASFSRASVPADARRPFYVYIDEFQSFMTESLVNMTAELRKYGIALVLAHQYLHQLEPDIRHAVLGNAGTLISFRTSAADAPFLAREFSPTFDATDLVSQRNYEIYLKLMIGGAPSQPFSATTLPPERFSGLTASAAGNVHAVTDAFPRLLE